MQIVIHVFFCKLRKNITHHVSPLFAVNSFLTCSKASSSCNLAYDNVLCQCSIHLKKEVNAVMWFDLLCVPVSQILSRSGWSSTSLWHFKALDVWKCRALAEGALRSRGSTYRSDACGQQNGPVSSTICSIRGRQGLCRSFLKTAYSILQAYAKFTEKLKSLRDNPSK